MYSLFFSCCGHSRWTFDLNISYLSFLKKKKKMIPWRRTLVGDSVWDSDLTLLHYISLYFHLYHPPQPCLVAFPKHLRGNLCALSVQDNKDLELDIIPASLSDREVKLRDANHEVNEEKRKSARKKEYVWGELPPNNRLLVAVLGFHHHLSLWTASCVFMTTCRGRNGHTWCFHLYVMLTKNYRALASGNNGSCPPHKALPDDSALYFDPAQLHISSGFSRALWRLFWQIPFG